MGWTSAGQFVVMFYCGEDAAMKLTVKLNPALEPSLRQRRAVPASR